MFNNAAFHCVGATEIAGSEHLGHGLCTYSDKDGDQIMAKWEGKEPHAGHSTLVGGTGKFSGISGNSDWTVQAPLKANDKFFRGIGSEKMHWKIQ
jgi:hypothetical protein